MYIRKDANKEKKKKKINVVSGLFQSFLARNCISSARNSIECKRRKKVNENGKERKRKKEREREIIRKREETRDRGRKRLHCSFAHEQKSLSKL